MVHERYVGTAGWSLPRDVRGEFPGEGSQLERYARRFSCVEINSSFYRPHRPATYAKWAGAVPDTFRFSLKIPKEITHTRRLRSCAEPLTRFLDESSALGAKRAVLLVQLPPSFAFDAAAAREFFALLRAAYDGGVACETRHATWCGAEAEELFRSFRVARVAADPAGIPCAAEPGGARELRYWRLHGAPRMYYSSYDDARLAQFAAAIRKSDAPAWCVFDNTTTGAAAANALTVLDAVTR